MTREELIQLCRDAVVHHTKWGNRDSYLAQVNIRKAYRQLTAGMEFEIEDGDRDNFIKSGEYTIWLNFPEDNGKEGEDLAISSREDYFNDCDPERNTEMFDVWDDSSFDFCSYIPTRKRLDLANGGDWY